VNLLLQDDMMIKYCLLTHMAWCSTESASVDSSVDPRSRHSLRRRRSADRLMAGFDRSGDELLIITGQPTVAIAGQLTYTLTS
jgi:hypothetical protein